MMNRRSLLLCAIFALLPFTATAQEAQPTPTPNPQEYADPGMHFTAPASYRAIGQRKVALEDLSDQPAVVAAWALPDPTRPKRIMIAIEAYHSGLDGFDATYEQQLRNIYGDAIFKNKEHTSLKNGMPALYFEMTAGTGFNATKVFTYVWVDGTRGVSLSLTSQVGEIDSTTAKSLLSDASAVRYPLDRQ